MTQDAPLDQKALEAAYKVYQRIGFVPNIEHVEASIRAYLAALSRRGGEAEPPAVALLRGPLSKRATSAEFNEWQAREVVAYIDRLRAASPRVAAPEGWPDVGYLMSIIDAAIEDGFDPDEDGPLLDQIRAELKAAIPEGKAEPVAYRFVPKEQTTVEDHIWRFAAMHPGDQWRVEPLFVAQVQHE